MKAIILVAGKGTRLKPLTEKNHKCLTEVCGVPILENALLNLKSVGVEEVTLVVGYLKGQIRDRIGNDWNGLKIKYAENDDFDRTNTSRSLYEGLSVQGGEEDCLILEGDVFFELNVLKKVLDSKSIAATVLEPYNETLDGTFAEINANSFVVDWVHKSARKEGYTVEDKFKTVNIHYFSKDFIKCDVLPELQKSLDRANGTEPIEYIMQRIVNTKNDAVEAIVLNGEKWFEVDDVNDLKIAEKIFDPMSINSTN